MNLFSTQDLQKSPMIWVIPSSNTLKNPYSVGTRHVMTIDIYKNPILMLQSIFEQL